MARHDALPVSLPPRGLCRVQAAQYVGVSPVTFDKMVEQGLLPGPKRPPGYDRLIWDRHALDLAFGGWPDDAQANPWDETP